LLDRLIYGYEVAIIPYIKSVYRIDRDPYTFNWSSKLTKTETIQWFSQWEWGYDYEIKVPIAGVANQTLLCNGKLIQDATFKAITQIDQTKYNGSVQTKITDSPGFRLTLADQSLIDIIDRPIIFLRTVDIFLLAKLSLT